MGRLNGTFLRFCLFLRPISGPLAVVLFSLTLLSLTSISAYAAIDILSLEDIDRLLKPEYEVLSPSASFLSQKDNYTQYRENREKDPDSKCTRFVGNLFNIDENGTFSTSKLGLSQSLNPRILGRLVLKAIDSQKVLDRIANARRNPLWFLSDRSSDPLLRDIFYKEILKFGDDKIKARFFKDLGILKSDDRFQAWVNQERENKNLKPGSQDALKLAALSREELIKCLEREFVKKQEDEIKDQISKELMNELEDGLETKTAGNPLSSSPACSDSGSKMEPLEKIGAEVKAVAKKVLKSGSNKKGIKDFSKDLAEAIIACGIPFTNQNLVNAAIKGANRPEEVKSFYSSFEALKLEKTAQLSSSFKEYQKRRTRQIEPLPFEPTFVFEQGRKTHNISDCGETAVRNILNEIFRQDRSLVNKIKNERIATYFKNEKQAVSPLDEDRLAWYSMIVNLPGVVYKYRTDSGSSSGGSGEKTRYNLRTGLTNFLNLMNSLFDLKESNPKYPELSLTEKLNTFCSFLKLDSCKLSGSERLDSSQYQEVHSEILGKKTEVSVLESDDLASEDHELFRKYPKLKIELIKNGVRIDWYLKEGHTFVEVIPPVSLEKVERVQKFELHRD